MIHRKDRMLPKGSYKQKKRAEVNPRLSLCRVSTYLRVLGS
jgi:hypothetical protein